MFYHRALNEIIRGKTEVKIIFNMAKGSENSHKHKLELIPLIQKGTLC